MASSDNSFLSLSSLLCEEQDGSLLNSEESGNHFGVNSVNPFYFPECEDEFLETSLKREMSSGSKSTNSFNVTEFDDDGGSSNGRGWLTCARFHAIQWILNTRKLFGFRFHTAYLSVAYFDQFLSRRFIKDGKLWAIRLLSVACLSLAAKMEESKVPALSDYPLDDYYFENKVIQRMELLVLSTLEWKMGSVTPFAYFNYFVRRFCKQSRLQVILDRATELIIAVVKETSLINHRPSVIASAAVLAAIDDQLTKKTLEIKLGSISTWGSIEIEHVLSCYNIMQETETRSIRTPPLVISSRYLTKPLSCSDALEKARFPSAAGNGTKRRLNFGDIDENCPLQKMHRTT